MPAAITTPLLRACRHGSLSITFWNAKLLVQLLLLACGLCYSYWCKTPPDTAECVSRAVKQKDPGRGFPMKKLIRGVDFSHTNERQCVLLEGDNTGHEAQSPFHYICPSDGRCAGFTVPRSIGGGR
jgi:hypothetical protein